MYKYFFAWKNNEKRKTLYLRSCKIVAHAKNNSRLIEFENGQREIVSGNSLRKIRS